MYFFLVIVSVLICFSNQQFQSGNPMTPYYGNQRFHSGNPMYPQIQPYNSMTRFSNYQQYQSGNPITRLAGNLLGRRRGRRDTLIADQSTSFESQLPKESTSILNPIAIEKIKLDNKDDNRTGRSIANTTTESIPIPGNPMTRFVGNLLGRQDTSTADQSGNPMYLQIQPYNSTTLTYQQQNQSDNPITRFVGNLLVRGDNLIANQSGNPITRFVGNLLGRRRDRRDTLIADQSTSFDSQLPKESTSILNPIAIEKTKLDNKDDNRTGKSIANTSTDSLPIAAALRIVNSLKLQNCAARPICELSCNANSYGNPGRIVFRNLIKLQFDPNLKGDDAKIFRQAAAKGRQIVQGKRSCSECFTIFPSCQADSKDLIEVSSIFKL